MGVGLGLLGLMALLWVVSPWFLWHLLPDEVAFKAVVKSDHRLTALIPELNRMETLVDSSTQIGLTVPTDGGGLFIVQPTLLGYFSLRRDLEQAGYQTSWYGPWLVAGRGGNLQHRSFWQALAASSFASWQSYNPLFMAEGRLWGLAQPLWAVGTVVGQEWRIAVSEQANTAFHRLTIPLVPPLQQVGAETADLTLPGTVLALLPERLAADWNELLRVKLGFTKTKPDFMAELTHYQAVHLVLTAHGVQLGVVGNQQRWQETTHHWLEDEERQFRIQRRLFRLPDGSFGTEYIPGARNLPMTERADHPGCYQAVIHEKNFWLCSGYYSFLTSTEELLAVAAPPPIFSVALGETFLPLIAQHQLRAALAVVASDQTFIRLVWRSAR